jgi:hypothetical protein
MTNVINDAEAYGVAVIPAAVEPGQTYWKVIRVHHLTPEENNKRHHIFINAIDEEGNRLPGARFLIAWDGGSDTVTIEDGTGAYGANFPIWKWQVCSVEGLDAPSDRVINLRTDHPDEPEGNLMFHHSFAITFQRTLATEAERPAFSTLRGRVPGGAGHTVALINENGVLQSRVVDSDGYYRFTELPAGVYLVRDNNDMRVAGPVTLNGRDEVLLNLPEPPPKARVFARFYLFPSPGQPETQIYLTLLADFLARTQAPFGFEVQDAAQAQRVYLIGDHEPATRETLAQADCEVIALPTDPAALLAAVESAA